MAPQTNDPHYFDEEPGSASDRSTVEVLLPDVSFTCFTDNGVFGKAKLDTGTKLLLMTPTPDSGQADSSVSNILDLGAGYGPISLTLARRNPQATVWAVDVNARARELCQLNAEAAELTNITVAAPDDVPGDIQFDQIWSNPPIRIGKASLHALLLRWLGQLAPRGAAYLVVQRHLGADSLQKWLAANDYETTRYRSQKAYRLLHTLSSSSSVDH